MHRQSIKNSSEVRLDSLDTRHKQRRLIRVLHFLPSLHMGAGMVSAVVNYHRHLNPSKCRFDYLILNECEPSYADEVIALGGRIFQVPLREYGLPGYALSKFLLDHPGEWDILHCHPIYGAELLGFSARQAGINHIIAHSHSTKYSDKHLSAARNALLSKMVGLFATDYIACTEDAGKLLGFKGRNAYVMHNAIDCDKFSFDARARKKTRAGLGIGNDCLFLGTLGRLAPQKNQAFLINVCAALKNTNIQFKMAVAGDGPLREKLNQQIAQLELKNEIMFLGTRTDAPALYSAFDAFLLTSLFEGLPVSAVEAQTSGLPCFLSDKITRETLFSSGMFLPIDKGPDRWVQAICEMAPQNVSERVQGIRAARSAGFDITVEASKLENYYESIMEETL